MCDIDIDSIKNEIYMNSNSFIVEQRAIKLEERRDGLSSNEDNTPTIYRYTGVLDMFINLEDCMKMAGLTNNEIDKLEKNALFPPRRTFGNDNHKWLLSDILEWMYDPTYITDYTA